MFSMKTTLIVENTPSTKALGATRTKGVCVAEFREEIPTLATFEDVRELVLETLLKVLDAVIEFVSVPMFKPVSEFPVKLVFNLLLDAVVEFKLASVVELELISEVMLELEIEVGRLLVG